MQVTERRILSLGAGVQSTTLYLLALDGRIDSLDVAIFADTQEEPGDVYTHLEWLKQQHGPPIIVRTIGKLGDDLMNGRNSTGQRFTSIPAYTAPEGAKRAAGMVRRQCTKEYKIKVVERAIRRDVLGLQPRQRVPKDVVIHQYFGISLDEARRSVNIQKRFAAGSRKGVPHFPLIELGWTRGDCQKYLKDRVPHPVPRSACVFCPYKNDAEWRRLKTDDPAGWARAVEVDEALRKAGNVVNRNMDQRLYLHRSVKPLAEVDLEVRQGEFPGFALECEGMCGN